MMAAGFPPPAHEGACAEADADVTHDTLLRGQVSVVQPKRGYRFSLDPILLSGFVAPSVGRFVDVGAGCGVVGLLLLARDPAARGVAVEIQPRLAALAAQNARDNGWQDRLAVHAGDFLQWAPQQAAHSFDAVVSNPPFYTLQGGHLSPIAERAMAHHEVAMSLWQWSAAAARLLAPHGSLAVIFPFERERDLLHALLVQGLSPRRVRRARPTADRPHHRVLVEATWTRASSVEREDDLIVHEGGGFSKEVLRYMGEAS